MANDIENVQTGVSGIYNGSAVVNNAGGVGGVGVNAKAYHTPAVTLPEITTIQAKYDARFDDPTYYG